MEVDGWIDFEVVALTNGAASVASSAGSAAAAASVGESAVGNTEDFPS